jgi:hypothetical protein
VTAATLSKEQARETVRALVQARLHELVQAQIDNALGIAHFMLRDPDTGQFKRLIDPDEIVAALNAPGAAEGSTFWIYAKDPSIAAFSDLMNRALDRPKEQVQEVHVSHDEALLARLDSWKVANRLAREAREAAAIDVAPVPVPEPKQVGTARDGRMPPADVRGEPRDGTKESQQGMWLDPTHRDKWS